MVDRDVALRKSEAIEHHASRLRAKLPLRAAAHANWKSFASGLTYYLTDA